MSSTKENTGMLRSICHIMAIVLVILVGTNTAHPQTPKEGCVQYIDTKRSKKD
jgi:hypothetical protein